MSRKKPRMITKVQGVRFTLLTRHLKVWQSLVMGRPLKIEYPGVFYHVTSRGNERRAIFLTQTNYERMIGYLESGLQHAVLTQTLLMARPLRIQFDNAYDHVTCRGNSGQEIFLNDADRSAFLDLLKV